MLDVFGNAGCVEDTGELEHPSLNFEEDTSIRDDEWKQYDKLVVCLDMDMVKTLLERDLHMHYLVKSQLCILENIHGLEK